MVASSITNYQGMHSKNMIIQIFNILPRSITFFSFGTKHLLALGIERQVAPIIGAYEVVTYTTDLFRYTLGKRLLLNTKLVPFDVKCFIVRAKMKERIY